MLLLGLLMEDIVVLGENLPLDVVDLLDVLLDVLDFVPI